MEKYIYNEENGLWYEQQDDHYIPCLKLPEEDQEPVGIWGQHHLQYIRQNKRLLYTNLLTTGKLNGYLADIDRRAEGMFSRLVNQLAEKEGVTEALKAKDSMKWVQAMNNIRNRAAEVVYNDLIYN